MRIGLTSKIPLLGLLLGLSSCTWHRLDIQTQYLSRENLASYYVGTPDPRLDHPTIGQRLLIQWSLPSRCMKSDPITLQVSLRFRDHTERYLEIAVEKTRGFYLYDCTDQEYRQTGGIATYYAEICEGSRIWAHWKHPLWAPLIRMDLKKSSEGS